MTTNANTIPPLTRDPQDDDEKRKAWHAEHEAYMAKPSAGIAKVGPNRWFWVWWPTRRAQYDGADPERYGFADSHDDALDKCGRETFKDDSRPRRININAYLASE